MPKSHLKLGSKEGTKGVIAHAGEPLGAFDGPSARFAIPVHLARFLQKFASTGDAHHVEEVLGAFEQFVAESDRVQVLFRIAKAHRVHEYFVQLYCFCGKRVDVDDGAMPPKEEIFFIGSVRVESDEIRGEKVVEVAHGEQRLGASRGGGSHGRGIRVF